MKKVVLAYSGGLDTSYCAVYLAKEKGLEVHAVLVNTGGFDSKELERIKNKSKDVGIEHFKVIDVTKRFYTECVRYLIYGNVLRNNTYPLSVSAERVFQAIAIAEYANEIGADYIAHGSTGAGNDQVRFDLVFNVLANHIEVITPIRDQQLSRQAEVEYLSKNGVQLDWEKAKYSINKGLWGTSVGGSETLTSDGVLPSEAYPSQLKKDGYTDIKLTFSKGELVGIDGKNMEPVEAIQHLERIASEYAVGRDVHVGDTIIGIKGRVGFEASSPLIILKAHHLLEKHTLTKWQQYWKEQLGNWYGMMVHEGQFLDPVLRNIEGFLNDSQKRVEGDVTVRLEPYHFKVLGIQSKYDLMGGSFGQYGEINEGWSGEDVKGFTKILSNQLNIYYSKDD